MSRLTMKSKRGEFYIPRRYEDGYGNNVVLSNEDCINKLGHYEDLEEQGRLIELPCKVGDKVYSVHSAGLSHAMIAEVYADAFCLMLCVAEGRFGKTVFTTREEAEAKLKEMEDAE